MPRGAPRPGGDGPTPNQHAALPVDRRLLEAGRMRRPTFLPLLITLVPACQSSSSSSSTADTAATEAACSLDAQTYCDKRKTCWPEGINDFRFQQSWGTIDKCVSDRK